MQIWKSKRVPHKRGGWHTVKGDARQQPQSLLLSGRGLREARFLSGESDAGLPLTTTTLWTSVLNSLSVLSFENKYIFKPKGKGKNEDEKVFTPSDNLVVEF